MHVLPYPPPFPSPSLFLSPFPPLPPSPSLPLPLFLQLSKPGRLDTDEVPTLQNTANVMDFVFDPFNNRRLVVGEN